MQVRHSLGGPARAALRPPISRRSTQDKSSYASALHPEGKPHQSFSRDPPPARYWRNADLAHLAGYLISQFFSRHGPSPAKEKSWLLLIGIVGR
jgi:hypothetical protein